MDALATRWLAEEARALRTRLDRLQPYAMQMPMVAAAAISPEAQATLEAHMRRARMRLRRTIDRFLGWLGHPTRAPRPAAHAQARFTVLRLRFNEVIAQFDLFADVLSQRSEHATGIWAAGLDRVATDALTIPDHASGPARAYEIPPLVCYVDRGHGAAIRRIRTRLPGGDANPVAVVRVPRERMVGSGIASSLVHEVGHQACELLALTTSLRPVLRGMARTSGHTRLAWLLWDRWISEILADFWSVARVGVGSTLGLMGVVGLPRVFVFRVDPQDPHPMPFVRVRLSCTFGALLYPDPQWEMLARLWSASYPLDGLGPHVRRLLALLERTMAGFATLVVHHRPRRLRGRSLSEALRVAAQQPARLRTLYRRCDGELERLRRLSPTLAFAVLGQARADGRLTPEHESTTVADLLTYWATRASIANAAACAGFSTSRISERSAA